MKFNTFQVHRHDARSQVTVINIFSLNLAAVNIDFIFG
jgi:hypothetical protein